MFFNLLKEMKLHDPKIKQKDLTKVVSLSAKSINDRINDKVDWSRSEMLKIRDYYFPSLTIEYLFKNDILKEA